MSTTEVIEHALRLTDAERIEIAEAIYQSLEGPVDPDAEHAWDVEIARRIQNLNSGKTQPIPWDEARRRIAGEL